MGVDGETSQVPAGTQGEGRVMVLTWSRVTGNEAPAAAPGALLKTRMASFKLAQRSSLQSTQVTWDGGDGDKRRTSRRGVLPICDGVACDSFPDEAIVDVDGTLTLSSSKDSMGYAPAGYLSLVFVLIP